MRCSVVGESLHSPRDFCREVSSIKRVACGWGDVVLASRTHLKRVADHPHDPRFLKSDLAPGSSETRWLLSAQEICSLNAIISRRHADDGRQSVNLLGMIHRHEVIDLSWTVTYSSPALFPSWQYLTPQSTAGQRHDVDGHP